ncbi:3-polyprenyl-4-hydroxybenzoate decarboxylase and related decarboxylases [Acinetobacter baumannii]|nr:3-polyprenyl-4-hydroxybenzoate decarboxylase and related decarboxylases [Acinetobacter baumannii]
MNRSALDFRHFVDHLRRQGDLVDVHTEVDANLEIGAITRRVYERRAPAPLFHNIRDSLPGARVLGAPAGLRADRARAHSRLALHFGLPEHSGPRDIVAMLRAAPAGARAGAGKRLARRAGGPDPLPGPLAP